MKKLILIPACVLLLSGAMPRNVEVQKFHKMHQPEIPAATTKIDSINVKAEELNQLIQQL